MTTRKKPTSYDPNNCLLFPRMDVLCDLFDAALNESFRRRGGCPEQFLLTDLFDKRECAIYFGFLEEVKDRLQRNYFHDKDFTAHKLPTTPARSRVFMAKDEDPNNLRSYFGCVGFWHPRLDVIKFKNDMPKIMDGIQLTSPAERPPLARKEITDWRTVQLITG